MFFLRSERRQGCQVSHFIHHKTGVLAIATGQEEEIKGTQIGKN